MANSKNSSWLPWSKHVLGELEDHGDRLDSIDEKMDNHITTIEHRLTKIETNYKNTKYILGLIFTVIILMFSVVLANYVG